MLATSSAESAAVADEEDGGCSAVRRTPPAQPSRRQSCRASAGSAPQSPSQDSNDSAHRNTVPRRSTRTVSQESVPDSSGSPRCSRRCCCSLTSMSWRAWAAEPTPAAQPNHCNRGNIGGAANAPAAATALAVAAAVAAVAAAFSTVRVCSHRRRSCFAVATERRPKTGRVGCGTSSIVRRPVSFRRRVRGAWLGGWGVSIIAAFSRGENLYSPPA